jgi:signal transduction histidine kinase
MLAAIRRAVRGQGTLSVEVTADVIDELSSSMERLERQAAELNDLDRVKNEMIETIQGWALTIVQRWEQLDRSHVETMGQGIQSTTARLHRLVRRLAASARLVPAQLEIATRPVHVSQILDPVRREYADRADLLDVQPGGVTALVWADPTLAATALGVVIENALAFDPSGPIGIKVSAEDDAVGFSVLDRGPGLSPALKRRVFEPFTQGESGTTRTNEGFGMGLYLASRIMEAHRGTIEVRDREGGGSVFTLCFPALPGRELASGARES